MDEKNEDNLIGSQILKEYIIKRKLGEGSFGKVYVAINTKTGALFAVKLVSNKYIFIS